VDVSFTQVPAYQVNTGRDSASKTTSGKNSKQLQNQANTSAAQKGQVAAQTNAGTVGKTAGAGAPTPTGNGGQKGVAAGDVRAPRSIVPTRP
jgi:hypothetical protein